MSAERFRNTAPSMARAAFLGFGALYLALGLGLGARGAWMGWLGLNLFVVGFAYALQSSRWLGKRSDGSFHPLALIVHAPFLAVCWLRWWSRRRGDEPAWNEVAPGIFVGRMVALAQLPPGVRMMVDLSCELFRPRARPEVTYRCMPTLDGCAPERIAFTALTAEVARFEGPVFICCAAGHGRSATLAAAVMIARGLATDVLAAEQQMQSKRALIGLGAAQRLLVTQTQSPSRSAAAQATTQP